MSGYLSYFHQNFRQLSFSFFRSFAFRLILRNEAVKEWNTAWRPKLACSNSSSLRSLAAVFFERRNATKQLRY